MPININLASNGVNISQRYLTREYVKNRYSSVVDLVKGPALYDYAAYIDLYSDLYAAWINTWQYQGYTKTQAGKRHWDNNGKNEGRTLPSKTFDPTTGFRAVYYSTEIDPVTSMMYGLISVDLGTIFYDWNTFNGSAI